MDSDMRLSYAIEGSPTRIGGFQASGGRPQFLMCELEDMSAKINVKKL